jgi:zinc protease
MRSRLVALLLASVLLPAPLASAQSAQSAQSSAQAAVPPIPFTTRTLPNGLKLYAVRDTATPNVSVQVWYDVGSKDDPEGRSGFAHLFEHLLFKATRNMPSETIDRLTEDVGGFNNAFTADDVTAYYEVVPANHLERLLWAEAERMGSLVVDEAIFASERDVVKEEYRQRILASPYGRLFGVALTQNSFREHPYKRPGIGDIEQLNAATIADVRAFHATYYRPDNASLIVVGNFDPAQLDRWVDQYFGRVQRPSVAIPRVTTREPARTGGARSTTVYAPNVPLPAVAVSYPGPAANHADAAAMDVLDAILSAGESSRLYRSLVYEQQVATGAGVDNTQNAQAGYFAPYIILAGGKDVAAGEAALLAEVKRVRDGEVTAGELEEAKTELLASALRERETADGLAQALGQAIILTGDARNADRELDPAPGRHRRRRPPRRPQVPGRRPARGHPLPRRVSAPRERAARARRAQAARRRRPDRPRHPDRVHPRPRGPARAPARPRPAPPSRHPQAGRAHASQRPARHRRPLRQAAPGRRPAAGRRRRRRRPRASVPAWRP